MNDLMERVEAAKTDNTAMGDLLSDYLPFIKKQLIDTEWLGVEYDDKLSIAMLAFINSVRQYRDERGNFLAFAATCIRSRLIDEARHEKRYASGIVLQAADDDNDKTLDEEERASLYEYGKEQERLALAEEIDSLSDALQVFGIEFSGLPAICPKQDRARKLCVSLAQEIIRNAEMYKAFTKDHRIPQAKLAETFHLSPKTVEKHRKYIVTLIVIFSGDYPGIRAFLPREVDL